MKKLTAFVLAGVFAMTACAASFEERVTTEAFVVTKAELRRHMAAPEDDKWRPAAYAELAATRDKALPNYLVMRFRPHRGGYYWGRVEARFDHGKQKLDVSLHSNREWIDYFIPLGCQAWRSVERVGNTVQPKPGGPTVTVKWKSLYSK